MIQIPLESKPSMSTTQRRYERSRWPLLIVLFYLLTYKHGLLFIVSTSSPSTKVKSTINTTMTFNLRRMERFTTNLPTWLLRKAESRELDAQIVCKEAMMMMLLWHPHR